MYIIYIYLYIGSIYPLVYLYTIGFSVYIALSPLYRRYIAAYRISIYIYIPSIYRFIYRLLSPLSPISFYISIFYLSRKKRKIFSLPYGAATNRIILSTCLRFSGASGQIVGSSRPRISRGSPETRSFFSHQLFAESVSFQNRPKKCDDMKQISA